MMMAEEFEHNLEQDDIMMDSLQVQEIEAIDNYQIEDIENF